MAWADRGAGRVTRPDRRWVLAAGAGLAVATITAGATHVWGPGVPRLHTAPDWYAAHLTNRGARAELDLLNQEWLVSGSVPGRGTDIEDMVRSALLDLRRLTAPSGALAAGAGMKWNYSWPRDAAFGALALACAGHLEEAAAALRFFAPLQLPGGGLESRYLLDGSGVPDARPAQSDGLGWVLWALGSLTAIGLGRLLEAQPSLAVDLRRLATGCLDHLLTSTSAGTTLPVVTADFWEVEQSRASLGLVAPMLAGLRGAATFFTTLDDPGRAARAASAAAAFEPVILSHFGPTFQRHGDRGGRDAGTAMLMPPFTDEQPAVLEAWLGYQQGAARASGGLAPGTDWWQHGESWTPQTALVAFNAASSGRAPLAKQWLTWLDSIRTPWGSLPEKVLNDGAPAGPAPLAWTAALVVLAAYELDRDRQIRTDSVANWVR